MRLISLNYHTWCKQHPPAHGDTWYRELYPYNVFAQVDFSPELIGVEQTLEYNRTAYSAKISLIEMQDNGRYRTTFELRTGPQSTAQLWEEQRWNTTFQIIYSDSYWFVSVYAKREQLKDYVAGFKRGSFDKITLNKSLPLRDLLFRTLALSMAEAKFPLGAHNEEFDYLGEGVRRLEEHPQFRRKPWPFTPLLAVARDTWVVVSFTEEQAHRLAFYLSNQCHNLYVVFCNPTYTRHHRCDHPSTHVLSLHDFANLLADAVRFKYEPQIRFLQNQLGPLEKDDPKKLLAEITNPLEEEYEVQNTDLMEAWSLAKVTPKTQEDAFHYLAAMNVINAWISKNRKNHKGDAPRLNKSLRDMYSFKTHVATLITDLIVTPRPFVKLFVAKNLALIEINSFQFAFHNVPKNETILQFEHGTANREIAWCGRRLQPLAPLLLRYARAIKN